MRDRELTQLRRQLSLPPLLKRLMETSDWRHPGSDVISRTVTFIRDPLVVLKSHEEMLFESGPLMGPEETENKRFSEYRGSKAVSRSLPWIDVEKTVFIMCNEIPSYDVGIALDYRLSTDSPRVVGGDWHSKQDRCLYKEISRTFDEFAAMLGLLS